MVSSSHAITLAHFGNGAKVDFPKTATKISDPVAIEQNLCQATTTSFVLPLSSDWSIYPL